ncbi:ComZ family protein [Bacillus piscicola]|uniref:ComZ family protein n=1 Tax=Bacillus piscicola TaxID=1632684 RepID=UPI001F099EE3|nr:ComZ family protein [Bacillus piscicola]
MDQELNAKFMGMAMEHLQEGRAFIEKKGIELEMTDYQELLELLMKVMHDAYNMGLEDGKK